MRHSRRRAAPFAAADGRPVDSAAGDPDDDANPWHFHSDSVADLVAPSPASPIPSDPY